jgi:hypothetical protein
VAKRFANDPRVHVAAMSGRESATVDATGAIGGICGLYGKPETLMPFGRTS